MALVRVQYDEPTTNADESPLADLASTKVYLRIGLAGEWTLLETFPATAPGGAGHIDEEVDIGSPQGTVYFRVTAVDLNDNESLTSAEVDVTYLSVEVPNVPRRAFRRGGLAVARGGRR